MHSLLRTIQEQPCPELDQQTYPCANGLSPKLRHRLLEMHRNSFDWDFGGLRMPIKFLDIDAVEFSLNAASHGDPVEAQMARLTLDQAAALVDPVWGGVYPHATCADWSAPQYQKPMAAQARSLRLYSMAYSLWQRPQDLQIATRIVGYLNGFLSAPNGAFFRGQSGELDSGLGGRAYFRLADSGRRQHGVPSVDQRVRMRENGWAIEALTHHAGYCAIDSALARALRAARQMSPPAGTGKCPANNADNDLTDFIALGRGWLALHAATAEPAWLVKATTIAERIGASFTRPAGGFWRRGAHSRNAAAAAQVDDNIAMTRFANLLFHYTKKARHYGLAMQGMRYLSAPEIATARAEDAGIMLAADELAKPPAKYIVYGNKTDTRAAALFACAQRQFGSYKLMQWRALGPHRPAYAEITLGDGACTVVSTPAELDYVSIADRCTERPATSH